MTIQLIGGPLDGTELKVPSHVRTYQKTKGEYSYHQWSIDLTSNKVPVRFVYQGVFEVSPSSRKGVGDGA